MYLMSEPQKLALGFLLATCSALGYGLLASRFTRSNDGPSDNNLAQDGVAGMAILTTLFMAAHFFVPLRQTTNLIILLPGVFAFPFFLKRRFLIELPVLAVMIWWAFQFTRSYPAVWDHGLYHLQSAVWNTLGPAIPGIANLHTRLGFNSSIFVLAAGLNIPVLGGWHLGLVSPALIEGMIAAALLLSIRSSTQTVVRLYCFVALMVLFYEPRWLLQWSYISPDPVVTMGVIYAVLLFLEKRTAALLLLVPFLITVKLAAAPLVLFLDWKPSSLKQYRIAAVMGMVILSIWVSRNVVISGHLLFPVAATRIPVPWAVPKDLTQNTANWITSWARAPGKKPEETRGLGWFRAWGNRTYENEPARSAFEIFCVGVALIPWRKALRRIDWRLFLAIALALLFWFVSAPDPRFAIGFMFAIAFMMLAYGLESIDLLRLEAHNAWIVIAVLIVMLGRTASLQHSLDWPQMEQPDVRLAVTHAGDRIWAPIPPDDRCWAVIPCTPEPDAIRYYPARAKMTFDPSRPSLR
jgi:hypothetical protein